MTLVFNLMLGAHNFCLLLVLFLFNYISNRFPHRWSERARTSLPYDPFQIVFVTDGESKRGLHCHTTLVFNLLVLGTHCVHLLLVVVFIYISISNSNSIERLQIM